jgi:hypothetical protein
MSSAVSKKSQENMNQKLGLVIKSGKYKLGKHSPDGPSFNGFPGSTYHIFE